MPHAFGQQLLVKPLADCVRRYPRVNVGLQVELAIVVGATVRNVDETHALSCIGGYTNFNDGSVRDFQKHSLTAGKNFDSSGACGPWVVTSDVIPDPTKLRLSTRLNGVEVRSSATGKLIYSIPFIISYLSKLTEHRPGDLIATGTPAGVGSRSVPPLWMAPGDRVEVEISGIGVLANIIQDAS